MIKKNNLYALQHIKDRKARIKNMEKLRNFNGIDFFENVDFKKIIIYSENPNPICGEYLTSLLFKEDLILIPIFNEVYYNKCRK